MRGHLDDLTGKRFFMLVVVKRVFKQGSKGTFWECRCDCGNVKVVNAGNLKVGNVKSCGCFRAISAREAQTTHGMTNTRTFSSWSAMRERCLNQNHHAYKNYGGRGIKICDRWKDSFENFLEDMGIRPDGKTLDRIDVDKGYCQDNCRWATKKEQCRNLRRNVFVVFGNKKALVIEVAEFFGVKYHRLHEWMHRNKGESPLRYIRKKCNGNFESLFNKWNNSTTAKENGNELHD